MLNVPRVILGFFLVIVISVKVDLRIATEARLNEIGTWIIGFTFTNKVTLMFGVLRRPWSDERHIANQDVEQLR